MTRTLSIASTLLCAFLTLTACGDDEAEPKALGQCVDAVADYTAYLSATHETVDREGLKVPNAHGKCTASKRTFTAGEYINCAIQVTEAKLPMYGKIPSESECRDLIGNNIDEVTEALEVPED